MCKYSNQRGEAHLAKTAQKLDIALDTRTVLFTTNWT